MTLDCVVDNAIRFDLARAPVKFIQDLKRETTYDNPVFYRTQAMGHWTGDIPRQIMTHVVDGGQMLIQRGSIGKLRRLAMHHGIELRWTDNRLSVPAVLKSTITARHYQQPAIEAALEATQGIIQGPCSAGKTYALLKLIEMLQQQTLVVVHKRALKNQWVERVHDLFGFDAGIIGDGQCTIAPITIGIQQTLWNGVDNYLNLFGTVCTDECHHAAARTHQTVTNKFPAKYRFGCSADPTRRDGKDPLVFDTFGDVIYQITKADLKKGGHFIPVIIRMVPTGFDHPVYREATAAAKDNNVMLNDAFADQDRNTLILNIIRSQYDPAIRRPMVVIAKRVEACKYWKGELQKLGIRTGLAIGENKREQEETRCGLISGEIDCAVSTTILDEGVDVPELARLFILTPGAFKDQRNLTQQIGRFERPAPGKKEAIVYIFWDDPLWPKGAKQLHRKFENVEVVDI